MAVTVTNTHILWNGITPATNPGLWNGTLPIDSFTADGVNLLPGVTYIDGSSILGATGARLYWNFLEILFGNPFSSGGSGAGGKATAYEQFIDNDTLTKPGIIENQVSVKVFGITAMLSEEKKQMYRLAKINVVGEDVKVKQESNIKVMVEQVELQKSEPQPIKKVTVNQFVKEALKRKQNNGSNN